MSYDRFKAVLKEFNEKYLISDRTSLEGKTIAFTDNNFIAFTDGCFCVLCGHEDSEEYSLVDLKEIIYYIRPYCFSPIGSDVFWNIFKKFLEQLHKDYLTTFNKVLDEDYKDYSKVMYANRLISTKRNLLDLQRKFPELEIKFNKNYEQA